MFVGQHVVHIFTERLSAPGLVRETAFLQHELFTWKILNTRICEIKIRITASLLSLLPDDQQVAELVLF